jgi:hypothetical protein
MTKNILIEAMRDKDYNSKDLSRLTGFAHSSVLRWVNGDSEPTYFAVVQCLEACGYKIKIERDE